MGRPAIVNTVFRTSPMPRRLLSQTARAALPRVPEDLNDLVRLYLLTPEDHALIRTRRRPENRLGPAVHIAPLRYPGQGWKEGGSPPHAPVGWLGEQLDIDPDIVRNYARCPITHCEHTVLAMRHLGLTPFSLAITWIWRQASPRRLHSQPIMVQRSLLS